MFVLAFFLDFFCIAFVVMPLLMPMVLRLGIDPAWFAVLVCVALQTSFMHPPFGVALYSLRSVAPPSVGTGAIYRGALPFIGLLLAVVALLIWQPRPAGSPAGASATTHGAGGCGCPAAQPAASRRTGRGTGAATRALSACGHRACSGKKPLVLALDDSMAFANLLLQQIASQHGDLVALRM